MMTLKQKFQWLAIQMQGDKLSLGGFGDSILGSYLIADSGNQHRLELAFKDLIEDEFKMWYKRID